MGKYDLGVSLHLGLIDAKMSLNNNEILMQNYCKEASDFAKNYKKILLRDLIRVVSILILRSQPGLTCPGRETSPASRI